MSCSSARPAATSATLARTSLTAPSTTSASAGFPETETFKDDGRQLVTKEEVDRGAFKTPGLREVTRHAPYMHDGSVQTLQEVVEFYNRGGDKNPRLDPKIQELDLTEEEIDALVKLMEALDGEGFMDEAPAAFPQPTT